MPIFRGTAAGALALIVAAAVLLTALPNHAVADGGCLTNSVTFNYSGAEQCYTVPAGVTQLSVTAQGAPGGAGTAGSSTTAPGGTGAIVNSTISVTPNETLYVEVGGTGDSDNLAGENRAAFNGGGKAGEIDPGVSTAGGGGGASDVRTCAINAQGCADGSADSLASRVVVAGGGGGGGGEDTLFGAAAAGGSGGAAGTDANGNAAAGADGTGSTGTNATGGQPGTSSTGGVGGAGNDTGDPGELGSGGAGADSTVDLTNAPGGGGGGGYYGGGGGGDSHGEPPIGSGAGGGGGSSFGPAGSVFTGGSTTPSVTISTGAPDAPVASTEGAGSITQTGATVNGEIVAHGAAVTYHFAYGTDDSYGMTTSNQTISAGAADPVNVSAGLADLDPNTTYHYALVVTSGGGSTGQDATLTTLPIAPGAATLAGTSIGATGAVFNGLLDTQGADTTAFFDYGTTAGYGTTTPPQFLAGNTGGTGPVSATVGGLTPNTTYHYRVSAANAGGSAHGEDATLTTLLAPPAVTTGSATALGSHTATVNGTLDAYGAAASYHFDYGPTGGYGFTTPTQDRGAGSSGPQSVSANVSGLPANAQFHYRLVASNAAGGPIDGTDATASTTPGAPEIGGVTVSHITAGSGEVDATIDAQGADTTYHVRYGRSTSYGSQTTDATVLGSTSGPQTVAIPLTGLPANTGIDIELDASNSQGSTAQDDTFTTAPADPVLSTSGATLDDTGTAATLHGTINPEGGAVTYHFDYGQTTDYGSATAAGAVTDDGTMPEAVSGGPFAVTPGAVYHYRLVAQSVESGDTVDSADATFTVPGTPGGPTLPPVVTEQMPIQGASGVVVLGTVNPQGSGTSYYFQYTAAGSSTPTQIGAGSFAADPSNTAPNQVSVTIPGSALTPNTTYSVQLVATNPNGTARTEPQSFTTGATAPAVSDGPGAASGVGTTTATVDCLVNPNNAATSVFISYEPYTGTVPAGPIDQSAFMSAGVSVAGSSQINIAVPVSGLQPGTQYAYSCAATNPAGTSYAPAPAATFTTDDPFGATTDSAQVVVGETTAQITGHVSSGGAATRYHVAYGISRALGSHTADAPLPAGANEQSVLVTLSPLQPNTTYYYALVATHSDGTTVTGAIEQTTTSKPTDAIGTATPNATTAQVPVTIFNPGLETGTYQVEYATDVRETHPQFTAPVSIPAAAGDEETHATATLEHLRADTTYYVQVRFVQGQRQYATDAVGIFTTTGYIRTDQPTQVTSTTATLNGEASGSEAYHFEYHAVGSTKIDRTPPTSFAGAGESQTNNFSAQITGLQPGVRYVYNLVGEDRAGVPVALDTAGGPCPSGAGMVSEQTVPGTSFVVTGCFAHASGGKLTSEPSGVFRGEGTIDVSGVEWVPADSNGNLSIETTQDVIATNEGYDVALGTITLYDQSEGQFVAAYDPNNGDAYTIADNEISGQASVYGFPAAGAAVVTPHDPATVADHGSDVALVVGLPDVFGGNTGTATTSIDNSGAFSKLQIQIGGEQLTSLITLPSFTLTYQDGQDWSGTADLELPITSKGISAGITFDSGQLTGISADVPDFNVPIGGGATLNEIQFSAGFSPFSLQGTIGLSAGPQIGGLSAANISAGFVIDSNSDQTLPSGLPGITAGTVLKKVPFTMVVSGQLQLLGFIPVADANLYYYGVKPDPFVGINGSVGLNLSEGSCPDSSNPSAGIDIHGDLAGDFQGQDFNVAADVGADLYFLCTDILSAKATGAVSSNGLAFCGTLGTDAGALSVGVGERWPSPLTFKNVVSDMTYFVPGGTSSCSLGPYEQQFFVKTSLAGPAHTASIPAITFAPGIGTGVLKFIGRGGAPLITVTGPGGRTAQTTVGQPTVDTTDGVLILPDPATDTTTVAVAHPGSGGWTATLQAGSPGLAKILKTGTLPPPRVTARVVGRCAVRTLIWHATAHTGQSLSFRVLSAAGDQTIVSSARASGRRRFRPDDAPAGRRQLLVDVDQDGGLRQVIHLGTFVGPTPQTPSVVRGLRLRRRGDAVIATWQARPGAGLDHYLVTVATTGGLRQQFVPTRTRVRIRSVSRTQTVQVTVAGVSRTGTRGKPARATLAGTQVKRPPRAKRDRR